MFHDIHDCFLVKHLLTVYGVERVALGFVIALLPASTMRL
jgi:hypothetical protein